MWKIGARIQHSGVFIITAQTLKIMLTKYSSASSELGVCVAICVPSCALNGLGFYAINGDFFG